MELSIETNYASTVHICYNLKRQEWQTQRPRELCTTYTRNYTHYQLPSCIGLQASSPPPYTLGCILYTHACSGCHTRTQSPPVLPQPCDSQIKLCAQPLMNGLIISTGYNCLQSALIIETLINCWRINWFGYTRLQQFQM